MLELEDKKIADVPLVVLDTETTGLHTGLGNRIVEIAAVRLEDWREVGRLSYLLQPERRMEPSASRINGIYDEDLAGAPRFSDIQAELLTLLDGALLAAHNAAFDAGFLGSELSIAGFGRQTPPGKPLLPNPWLCTLLLARRYFYFGQNNLAHVAARLGVPPSRAHRALSDVYTTAEVLKRMTRELRTQRLFTIGDLLQAQGGPLYTPRLAPVTLPEPLATAVRDKSALHIIYAGPEGQTERRVTPRYAAQHEGVTYLIAYCHLREDQRSFRLDRIMRAWPATD